MYAHKVVAIAVLLMAVLCTKPTLSQSTSSCDTPDCLRKRVDELLAKEVLHLQNQGFVQSHRTRFASLDKGRSEAFRIDLTAGAEYALIAACASACDHVQLRLSTSAATLVESPEKQAVVILGGAAPETGDYVVTLSAPGCQSDKCGIGFVIVRKAAPPSPAASSAPKASATSPVAAPTVSFSAYDNYDMIGEDIEKIQKIDQDACASACRADSRCVAFSYDKWNKWCFTKDSTNELIFTARSMSALRDGAAAPTFGKGDLFFERFRNKGFPKQSQPKQVTDTFEKCEALCAETDWCAAFTYYKSTDECQRFRATGEYFSNSDADSGAKRQKAPNE